ncbi:DUF4198 domain-containing protein [uncultured Xylophilus sp.]|uniref:DUF4198 domain-containing protein n=1 Tax=uncultured Xylophilus sp. TaxID=296832 RepID=UPI0025EECC1E|nr:DUF4198 domain-containing protein [uncultured Xylophilus sp.]
MLKPTLFAALLTTFGCAQAHVVWLEPVGADGTARAYFGEWADDVRETDTGYLKLVTAPRAPAPDGTLLPVMRHHDHLMFQAAPQADARLVGGYVNDKGTISLYQAKTGRTETQPRNPLELVPTAPNANTFVLLLAGQPLAGKDVVLSGPPKWEKKFKTDNLGRVTLQTPWPGQYVAEMVHLDTNGSGSWDGKPYSQTRHVATLTFLAP